MPEQMRGQGSATVPIGTTFSLVNGGVTSTDVMPLEDYRDNVELYKRIRSYLNTLSLISISDRGWFPFMVGDSLADQILAWMNTTYN